MMLNLPPYDLWDLLAAGIVGSSMTALLALIALNRIKAMPKDMPKAMPKDTKDVPLKGGKWSEWEWWWRCTKCKKGRQRYFPGERYVRRDAATPIHDCGGVFSESPRPGRFRGDEWEWDDAPALPHDVIAYKKKV